MALQCILPEHSKNNLNSHFNLNGQDLGKSTAKNLLIISIPICESEIQTFCENLLKFKKINVYKECAGKKKWYVQARKSDCTWYAIISKIQYCWSSYRLTVQLDNNTGNVYDQVLFVLPLCKIRTITFLVVNHKLINPVLHPVHSDFSLCRAVSTDLGPDREINWTYGLQNATPRINPLHLITQAQV